MLGRVILADTPANVAMVIVQRRWIAYENFLVPVDFVPGNSISGAKFSCMSVARIFDELARKRAKKNIVILEIGRANPVAEKYSLEAGLAQPQNPGKETYIAFST